ncbi:hypothetical protein METUNv1_02037 [Methyloversatilis universalis FAM5]|uniref:Uncharacterized protein n=1 Tax=Methyloversatilis universalis (strain ATCC BAA-1314 / DSM 25237 / JCM 13912 / CCUG 52030 / FAM5) TaxID=1000565 RepID=F5RCN3_METUF|nr:hypothetical protein METUNv1_02037 [Methyloversatilis universalis FAM5]
MLIWCRCGVESTLCSRVSTKRFPHRKSSSRGDCGKVKVLAYQSPAVFAKVIDSLNQCLIGMRSRTIDAAVVRTPRGCA